MSDDSHAGWYEARALELLARHGEMFHVLRTHSASRSALGSAPGRPRRRRSPRQLTLPLTVLPAGMLS